MVTMPLAAKPSRARRVITGAAAPVSLMPVTGAAIRHRTEQCSSTSDDGRRKLRVVTLVYLPNSSGRVEAGSDIMQPQGGFPEASYARR